MTSPHEHNRLLLQPLFCAQYNWHADTIKQCLHGLCTTDTVFKLAHPFGEMSGAQEFYHNTLAVLKAAWPDVERRDWLIMSGEDEHGLHWVGCGGHFVGTFQSPFLDIPPTGHYTHMRFHEFYRIDDGKVVEYQALWDIPEVMMQANAWPMAPSLGREFCVPGPASGDGLTRTPRDNSISENSRQLIIDMLNHMTKHPSQGGPEVMEMPRFWDSRMNWYGPAGIGTGRGINGFRHWHQIPFLNAMPDRGQHSDEIIFHFFADNQYCAVTGWPNMVQTVSDDGWMGIAPSGKTINLRSLDFWRIDNGRIRENWVLVDILDVYRQLNVDVFARLREFNKARPKGNISYQ